MNDKQQRQEMLRLRQLLSNPQSDPVEIADCYVRLLSRQLQELALTGYQRDGRGAIEIDLRGMDLRTAQGGLPIEYCPPDVADDWPEGTDEVIATYDPGRELIVVLLQDSGPLVYVLEQQ